MRYDLDFLLGRRQLLLGAAGLTGAGLLAACGSDSDDAGAGDDPPAASAPTSTPETESSDPTEATGSEESETPPEDDASTSDGEPVRGGTLNIGQDFGPQDMDPTISGAWASTNVQEFVFTGLLRWDADMELEPDLATEWEIVDDLTYVFTLREGVTFHHDKPFTAEDVKFTFERIKDPEVASPRISTFANLESIDVLDDYQVQFNLTAPIAPLLRLLATIPTGAIVPSDLGEDFNTAPVGTGAFRYVEHVLDQEVKLEAFEGYYEEGLPYLDAVNIRLLGDDTSITSALRSETVHMAWIKDPKVAQNVSDTTEGLLSIPGVSSRFIPVAFDLVEPPFNDVNVRRALSLALNRQAILDAVLGGFGSIGTFLPPSQLGGYTGDGSDLPYYTQDIEEAKRLLSEAGYDRLEVPEFKVVAANQLDVQCAQILQEQWAAANIDVQINPMEVGAILQDWSSGNYKMGMLAPVWSPDPSVDAARFGSEHPFGQGMGIDDEELDDLIAQGLAETDPDERVVIYQQIQERVLDQVYAIIPYAYPLRWELVWEYVKGYDVVASNARMSVRKTWLDQ